MKIFRIKVENYRLLKDFSIDLEEDLSLVIGKNNTGKTSLLTILEKFLNHSEKTKFSIDDFNIEFKKTLADLVIDNIQIAETDFLQVGIKLKIFIQYNDKDDLSNISRVMMDLDPDNNVVVLGFEYILDYDNYLKIRSEYLVFDDKESVKEREDTSGKYKKLDVYSFLKQEHNKFFITIKKSIAYDNGSDETLDKIFINLDKENVGIKDIINFKYISARRDVTNKDFDKTLSKQTSIIYKRTEENEETKEATEKFKDQLTETDRQLSTIYVDLFEEVIEKVRIFGGIKLNESEIEIISTLQHRELLEGNTTVVYKHDDNNQLPEHYNGLGYMNLISMIFEIEILVHEFKREKDKKPSDINLLFIEEPEAHTHPQMQYVFIKNIKKLLGDGIKRHDNENRILQYIISTHSSCIVADSDFDDIKYLKKEGNNGVVSKNLTDLKKEYATGTTQYQFLTQYLTISRAEIFFADKAVLIEGDTERILIPTVMKKIDIEEEKIHVAAGTEDPFLPLLSQNISIIEVGAYSQIFEKFIEFLGIKSLVITDIDSKGDIGNKDKKGNVVIEACPVNNGTATSNSALLHFLPGISWEDVKILTVEQRTIKIGDSTLCLCYQQEENAYHARSFEDAFIHLNREFVKNNKNTFQGLKNIDDFDDDGISPYDLAKDCIKKKTHFALDILYHSDEYFSNWSIPAYIKNGLLWLKKD
ncbi:MAG: ATP-dependent endonuclease [Chitinophagales bacterium]